MNKHVGVTRFNFYNYIDISKSSNGFVNIIIRFIHIFKILRLFAMIGFTLTLVIFFLRWTCRSGFFDMLDELNEAYQEEKKPFMWVGIITVVVLVILYHWLEYTIYGKVDFL